MAHRGVHRVRRLRRVPILAGVLAVCTAGIALVASNASADAPQPLNVSYQVKGMTTVAKQNLTFRIGHTQLSAAVLGGAGKPYQLKFTADLPIPPKTVSFKADGLVPETATVNFTQVGPVTGGLLLSDGAFREQSKALYTVSLSDVSINGVPVDVTDQCQTVDPVVVHASSPTGKTFDLSSGGTITSKYAIGQFQNCGLYTDVVNQQIPGGGNFISLTLYDGAL